MLADWQRYGSGIDSVIMLLELVLLMCQAAWTGSFRKLKADSFANTADVQEAAKGLIAKHAL